jgi:hypothetical protein
VICDPWHIKLNPLTPHAARWSLPIVMAEYWIEDSVTLRTFERPSSERVRDLAKRMTWEPMQQAKFPEMFGAEVICHLRSGDAHTVRIDDVYGNASRPAKAEEIRAKFRSNAAYVFDAGAIDSLQAALQNLKDAPQLNALTAALRSQRLNGGHTAH